MNEYFRYTLKDLEEGASQKKFNYITFFAGGGGSSCGRENNKAACIGKLQGSCPRNRPGLWPPASSNAGCTLYATPPEDLSSCILGPRRRTKAMRDEPRTQFGNTK